MLTLSHCRARGLEPVCLSLPAILQHHTRSLSARRRPLLVCSSSPDTNSAGGGDASPEELIQQLLASDPAAVEQVGRVTAAATKVAELQMEQARLARAMADAEGMDAATAELRERQAQASAATMVAEAEAKAAQLLLQAAQLEAEAADSVRDSVGAQADLEAERLETAKAGAAAAAGGTAAAFPIAAASAATPIGALLALGGAVGSAFLFGLVYRYALREDLGNSQLKSGVVAAFGLVRGLGQAMETVGTASDGFSRAPEVEAVGAAAAQMGEAMLLFGFAAVALEYALQRDWVKPFKGF